MYRKLSEDPVTLSMQLEYLTITPRLFIYKSTGCVGYETVEAIGFCTRSTTNQPQQWKCSYDCSLIHGKT